MKKPMYVISSWTLGPELAIGNARELRPVEHGRVCPVHKSLGLFHEVFLELGLKIFFPLV
jgi:hypothetical protein